MSNDTAKLTEKIAKLFARADHPNTSEHEAAACREKAEKLMREHKISEAMFHLTEEQERVFEQYLVPAKWSPLDYGTYQQLAVIAFNHAGCQFKHLWGVDYSLHVVGYPADVFYGKVLFERAIVELEEVLNPQWNDTYTENRNVYRFRNAGLTWEQVQEVFAEHTGKRIGVQALHARYQKWAQAVGEEKKPGTRRHEAYRRSVQEAFRRTLWNRLADLRARSGKQDDEPGEYAIALIKDEDALLEEFYNLFPEMRPETEAEREARQAKDAAERAEAEAAEKARWERLTDAQRAAEQRAKERAEKRAQKAYEAYRARNVYDSSGWAVGNSAAEKVRVLLSDEVANNGVSLEA